MNYELAKQLKDAGFPQDKRECQDDPYTCCEHGIYYNGSDINDTPYYPTLSELIEACGERFYALRRAMDIWMARDDYGFEFKGKTPEEAVAKLYLKLNEKNTTK